MFGFDFFYCLFVFGVVFAVFVGGRAVGVNEADGVSFYSASRWKYICKQYQDFVEIHVYLLFMHFPKISQSFPF